MGWALGTTERRRLSTDGRLVASAAKCLGGSSFTGSCESNMSLAGFRFVELCVALEFAFSSLSERPSSRLSPMALPAPVMGVPQHRSLSFSPAVFKRLCSIGLGGGLHSAQGSVCEAPGVSCHTLWGLCLQEGETVKGSLPSPLPSEATAPVGSLASLSCISAPPC